MKKRIALFLFITLLAIAYFYIALPLWGMPFNAQRHHQLPLTPAWALECWLWEDDVNTAEYVDELLDGYEQYDIPVRTILIDSPWSTRYNDFQVDTSRYPNPEAWFGKLQDKGYRVVLWMTPNINKESKDTKIKEARDWTEPLKDKGFLVGNDDQVKWWKGRGGYIDYTNPEAVAWWREQQQAVFDYGIDGWKMDGSATLLWSKVKGIPFFYKRASDGLITTRTYMDQYYRQEYFHGLTQNPEFVTLSRSIDRKWTHPEGFSPFDASPVNWVGDQRHSWKSGPNEMEDGANSDLVMDGVEGIEMAIEHILASAKVGYNIIGSDVAGFSGREIPPRLYIRWAQLSTFCGLFLNGGHGERRLWMRSEEELEIIRKFSWLHTELIPYMYHYVVTAHQGGKRLQKPLRKGKYHYLFGDDFLVAPIYQDSKTNSATLPKGQWRYFFDDKTLIEGATTLTRDFPMEEYPVFIKEGAIIPLDIKRSYTGLGDETSEGFTTILIYPLEKHHFTLYKTDNSGETKIAYVKNEDQLEINMNGDKIPHILRIHAEASPKEVVLDSQVLEAWRYDAEAKKLIIRTSIYENGKYQIKY